MADGGGGAEAAPPQRGARRVTRSITLGSRQAEEYSQQAEEAVAAAGPAQRAMLRTKDEARATRAREVDEAAASIERAAMGTVSKISLTLRFKCTLFLSPASLAALECSSVALRQLAELSMMWQAKLLGAPVPARWDGESSALLLRFLLARRARLHSGQSKLAADQGRSAVITPSGNLFTAGIGYLGHWNGVGYDDADATIGEYKTFGGVGVCCIPTQVRAGLRGVHVASIAVDSDAAAFTTSDGRIFTWGESHRHPHYTHTHRPIILGHGEGVRALLPRQVQALAGVFVVSCSVSWAMMAALTASDDDDGRLFTWGRACGQSEDYTPYGTKIIIPGGSWSMMGYATEHDQHLPRHVDTVECVSSVDLGRSHMAIVAQQRAYTCGWSGLGDGEPGRLGHGGSHSVGPMFHNFPIPVQSLAEINVVAVAAGDSHTAFLSDDGMVLTCGYADGGGLGHDPMAIMQGCSPLFTTAHHDAVFVPKPVERLLGHRVVSVSICHGLTVVVTDEGRMFAFGCEHKEHDQEGHWHEPQERSALKGTRVVDAAAGCRSIVAITSDDRQLYANGHLDAGHEGGIRPYMNGELTAQWVESEAQWGVAPGRVVSGGEDGTFFDLREGAEPVLGNGPDHAETSAAMASLVSTLAAYSGEQAQQQALQQQQQQQQQQQLAQLQQLQLQKQQLEAQIRAQQEQMQQLEAQLQVGDDEDVGSSDGEGA